MLVNSAATKARFQEFKARRAAEKEANRLRLAAEFPVLFNTTSKKAFQKTPTLNTKRKSVFNESNNTENENIDVNDENNSKHINKLVNEKSDPVSKIPHSNKKVKKIYTNNVSIKENESIKDKHEAKFNKLQQLIIKCPPQSPMPSSMGAGLELTSFSLIQESAATDAFLLEASAEEVRMSHEPIFQSPIASNSIDMNQNNNNSANDLEHHTTETMTTSQDNELVVIQEQVNDVMDFLLECNEIDVVTHRRVSSLSFSAQTLKRLSISNKNNSNTTNNMKMRESLTLPTTTTVCEVTQKVDNNLDDTSIMADDEVVSSTTSTCSGLEAEDVLVALRNFINTLDHNVMDASTQQNDVVDDDGHNMIIATTATSSSSVDSTHQDDKEKELVDIPSNQNIFSEEVTKNMILPATVVLNAAIQQSNMGPNHIMTYPLSELLEDALGKGLLVVEVVEKIHIDDLIQYHLETQILSVPGYPAENSKVRITSYKRYNDFKSLKKELVEYFKAKHQRLNPPITPTLPPSNHHNIDDHTSTTTTANNNSDNTDVYESILSRLPFSKYHSNRSSSISTIDTSSSMNNRCSIDTKDTQESVYERYASLIPQFPKEIINDQGQNDMTFEDLRFKFLQDWLIEVYSKQSNEDKEYRIILRKFLTT